MPAVTRSKQKIPADSDDDLLFGCPPSKSLKVSPNLRLAASKTPSGISLSGIDEASSDVHNAAKCQLHLESGILNSLVPALPRISDSIVFEKKRQKNRNASSSFTGDFTEPGTSSGTCLALDDKDESASGDKKTVVGDCEGKIDLNHLEELERRTGEGGTRFHIPHFEYQLSDETANSLLGVTGHQSRPAIHVDDFRVNLGNMTFQPTSSMSTTPTSGRRMRFHPKIEANLDEPPICGLRKKGQRELVNIFGQYVDFYYPTLTAGSSKKHRVAYTVHTANHLMMSRDKVIENGSRLKLSTNALEQGEAARDATFEGRDQGFTRPRVLMIVPFRESAFRIVNILTVLYAGKKKGLVVNRKRFHRLYGPDKESLRKLKAMERPSDYKRLFAGNSDDCFRLGLAFGRKSLKLFTDFYSSDLIIASPLGLRMAIGTNDDKQQKYDFDFLSSLEMVIVDQADVCMMQNWDHILHIWDHLHRQPKASHDVDFSRIREWCLNGWSKLYCQTLVFSAVALPEIKNLITSRSLNYAGKLLVSYQPDLGSAQLIAKQLPQAFHRFDCSNPLDHPDARLQFFMDKIMPTFTDSEIMGHTLIFIPSYFDFVRIRNRFKADDVSFVQVCEYTKERKVTRARDIFFHGRRQFCLYTERFHFFHRYHIKGIRHVIFYQLPCYPHFYTELCDMVDQGSDDDFYTTCTVLYSKFDALRLSGAVGHKCAQKFLGSLKGVHIIVSGE